MFLPESFIEHRKCMKQSLVVFLAYNMGVTWMMMILIATIISVPR